MVDLSSIQKILIIRMSSIGDIILTSPVIRQVREQFPYAQIDYLVRREFAELVKYNSHLSNVIELKDRRDSAEAAQLKQQIQAEGYDVIVDLHRNIRSRRLCQFAGHPPIFAVKKNQLIRFLYVNFKINRYKKSSGGIRSVTEKYLRAAAPLGISFDDQQLDLSLSSRDMAFAENMWVDLKREHFGAVMAPGARHFTKRWPADYYARLICLIFEKTGKKTLLLGGPDEIDTIAEIQKSAGTDTIKSLAGDISLAETLAVIKKSPFFISNDSGLMHAAAAAGIPQIAIFGSTTQELGFFPLNKKAVVLENKDLACRPCSHIGKSACPKRHFKCMLEITPESVFQQLMKMQNRT